MENEDLAKERIKRMGKAGIDLEILDKYELIVLIEGEKTHIATHSLVDGGLRKTIILHTERCAEIRKNQKALHTIRAINTATGPYRVDLSDGSAYLFYSNLDSSLRKKFADEGVRVNYPIEPDTSLNYPVRPSKLDWNQN